MNESLLTLVLSSGASGERREACEFLDLKTRVEEEKYRQLSADLERRRIRKYNSHLEEQKKIEKELEELEKDRLRFEREKQLRKRKSFSASRGKKQTSKSSGKEEKITLPMNKDALGGSASIAFDPKVERYSRRRRRKAKTETSTSNSRKAEQEITNDVTNFPYLSEREVKKFHQSCKSAGRSPECRRWGAAWLYAKKEQEKAMNKSERWTALLLNAEKEKMRLLCEKLTALKERKLNPRDGKSSIMAWTSLERKSFSTTEKNAMEDKENVKVKIVDGFEGENVPSSTKGTSGNFSNFPTTKQQGFAGYSQGHNPEEVLRNDLPFVSPFSKGVTLAKKLAFRKQSFTKSERKSFSKPSKCEEDEHQTKQTLLQDVSPEDLRTKKNDDELRLPVTFLPQL